MACAKYPPPRASQTLVGAEIECLVGGESVVIRGEVVRKDTVDHRQIIDGTVSNI